MSSTKELLKFFFDYLKIYKSTSSSTVAKWKQGDLNNALKWSSLCEEVYAKIKNKKSYQKLIDDLGLFKEHWKIDDCDLVAEILADASIKLKKVFYFKSLLENKHLCEDLRQKIIESIYEKQQEKPHNFDYDLITQKEINNLCIKLCQSNFNQTNFDSLIDFTIHKEKNFDFLILVFQQLKKVDYQKYNYYILRIMNKRFCEILMQPNLIELFSFTENKQLNEAYFTYLYFLFSDTCAEIKLNNHDVTDPKHQKTERVDLAHLVAHFENCINTSSLHHPNSQLIRILLHSAEKDPIWNILINKLKFKILKVEEELILDEIIFDE